MIFCILKSNVFGKQPEDIWLGDCISLYIRDAVNHKIRYNSSSGGVVTELSLFTLEEGFTVGAFVTRMSRSNLSSSSQR